MRWTLGIDTSSTSLHLGLLQDGKPFLTSSKMVLNSHAEHITPLIKLFLRQADISAQDIAHVGVVTGPGSFTGIRIGLSFIKGMFVSGQTKVLPLNNFETTAHAVGAPDGVIAVALDARQDNLFWASFKKQGTIINNLDSPIKIAKNQFYSQYLSTCDTLYYDTMGFTNSSLFSELEHQGNAIPLQSLVLSKGIAAAQIADAQIDNSEVWSEAVNIFPNYMQESYAERSRK